MLKNQSFTPDQHNKILAFRDHLKLWPWQIALTIQAPSPLHPLTHDTLVKHITRLIMRFTKQNVAALHIIVPADKDNEITNHAHILMTANRPHILTALSLEILEHLYNKSALAIRKPDPDRPHIIKNSHDKTGASIDLQPIIDERTLFYMSKNVIKDGGDPFQFNPALLAKLKEKQQ